MPDAHPRPFPRTAVVCAAVATLSAGACTTIRTPAQPEDPVEAALAQPLRDLSLVQSEIPPRIREIAADPYRPGRDCAAIAAELAELRTLLGPDLDEPVAEGEDAGLAGAVVAGATSLPFRGVIRRITGAQQRDEAAADAVLGAMVRRGFLKGERAALGCGAPRR